MGAATVYVSAEDLHLAGTYESTEDVLYLSAPGDDKSGLAQETPEGHAVRLDREGRVTHLTAINARGCSTEMESLSRRSPTAANLRVGPRGIADLMA